MTLLARLMAGLSVRLLVLLILEQLLTQLINLLVLRVRLWLLIVYVHNGLGRRRRAQHALLSSWRLQLYLTIVARLLAVSCGHL